MNKQEFNHEELTQEAVKLFAIHPSINKLYMTARGQAFTEKHRAEAETRYLEDKEVYTFDRHSAPDLKIVEKSDDNREALMKEHEELFGKSAPHNIGTEKLAQKIAEEKALRANQAKQLEESQGEDVEDVKEQGKEVEPTKNQE